MQNDKVKCGLIEHKESQFIDSIEKEVYVWYEQNWKHDDYEHTHKRAQLTYVEARLSYKKR
jgi:hypothetical protein